MELGVDGEDVGRDAFLLWGCWLRCEDDVIDDGADAVVDSEAGLVPCVEGEEDGVVGKERDAGC